MNGVESDSEAAEKAITFLENIVRHHDSVQSYELVRIVQEEVTESVKVPPLRSYGEIRWPKKAS